MKPKEDIFELIKSLTKSEKGYYKKYSQIHTSGQNNYIRLFDEISKQVSSGSYNEKYLKEKFEGEKFIKNFPVAKAYLYDTILKSLNSYYSNSNIDNSLKDGLRSIEILYKKALFKQALRLLKKGKQAAYRYDSFINLLELIKWEKNLIHEGIIEGDYYKNLELSYSEEQDVLNKIKNLSDYRFLSFKSQNLSGRLNILTAEADELLANPLLTDESAALSFPAKINFFHIKSALYEIKKEFTQAYQCRKKIIELMEENPGKTNENRVNYLIALYNLIMSCSSLKLYDEFNYYLPKLRSLITDVSGGISENIKILAFIGTALLELNMFLNTGKIKEGLTSLPGIIEGISNYKGKITKHDEAYCMFLIADIYFRNKKFDEALIWLNKLNDEAGVPDDILINAKIFLLVVHFELGNNRLLEYLIRSTYRFLKSKKNPDEAEKAVINFLKKIPSILNTKELFAHFQGTINELERIKSKNPELNLFKRFDFIEYLNSKLEELKNASLNSA